jgi:hypothetical protein
MMHPSATPTRAQLFLSIVGLLAALTAAGFAQGTKPTDSGWQSLFDGKALGSWQPSKFGGDGTVRVENSQIVLDTGKPFTGITWTGPEPPTTNYEIALEAMRVEGRDFFAGITFPVGDSSCSLILGGWGGTVIGLSSVNGEDASQNQTSQSTEFELGRWYKVRIRVTDAAIETWLDDRQIIKQERKGNKIGIRVDMEPSLPLGIASYRTKAALRDLRLRKL